MSGIELARLLMAKAAQDEFVLRRLIDDPESPSEAIGFHAQQAVEKLFKALLASQGVRYRKTHNLAELLDLMLDNGISVPRELEGVRDLTPFAAEFRYDEFLPDSNSAFDRLVALDHVKRTRAWVETLLA
jgi:HEPN domain-containing protein